jgi:hypothetical protein
VCLGFPGSAHGTGSEQVFDAKSYEAEGIDDRMPGALHPAVGLAKGMLIGALIVLGVWLMV